MLSKFKPSIPYETGELVSLSKCPVFSTNAFFFHIFMWTT